MISRCELETYIEYFYPSPLDDKLTAECILLILDYLRRPLNYNEISDMMIKMGLIEHSNPQKITAELVGQEPYPLLKITSGKNRKMQDWRYRFSLTKKGRSHLTELKGYLSNKLKEFNYIQ